MYELREDQANALEALRSSVAEGKRRIVMQAPTGMGKTVIAAAIVENARNKGKRVLFTVPAIALVDQTLEAFYSQHILDVGVIQASHPMTDWSQPVQVASIQTLMRREVMPEADVIIIDEVHRWFSLYEKLLLDRELAHVPMIGLSATPWRKGMGDYFNAYIKAMTTQELIDRKVLSDFRVYAPSHPDLTGVHTVAGDYHEGELSTVMQDKRLVADAVETWLRLARGRPTLCFAVDRAHAQKLQAEFQAQGVECGYQDAKTDAQERKRLKTYFHHGEIAVIVSVGTLVMGVDWNVGCISMCRPTKSDMLFVQIIGRGLRKAKDKDFCLILDHSDNHDRLGFVTDVDESYLGLLGGYAPRHDNRTEAIRKPKPCPHCGVLKAPKTAKCPACGGVSVAQCTIEPEPGELRELKRKPKEAWPVDKGAFLAELKAYGIEHAYKPGWASNQYRAKLGVWPNHQIADVEPAARISSETRGWIKSRQIAWANRREQGDENIAQSTDR
jgi:DNA repair protein RadD